MSDWSSLHSWTWRRCNNWHGWDERRWEVRNHGSFMGLDIFACLKFLESTVWRDLWAPLVTCAPACPHSSFVYPSLGSKTLTPRDAAWFVVSPSNSWVWFSPDSQKLLPWGCFLCSLVSTDPVPQTLWQGTGCDARNEVWQKSAPSQPKSSSWEGVFERIQVFLRFPICFFFFFFFSPSFFLLIVCYRFCYLIDPDTAWLHGVFPVLRRLWGWAGEDRSRRSGRSGAGSHGDAWIICFGMISCW